ncbi:MAG: transposase [Desulfovibrionaceae bacterium]|nr:transposase [Desulfovibrionaceae bacterium]
MPVALVNPRQVRGMVGKKTDKKDASWLSTVGILGTYTPSYIPTEQWRDLRSSSRYLTKVIATRQAYKNRENKAFIDAGFRLNSVFSDPFGKNAQIAKDGILAGKTPENIIASIDAKRLKASHDELLAAFNGELREEHKLVIECTRSTIKFLENEIDKLREHIISKAKELELQNFMLLMTVPDFNELSAAQFIIEIGGRSFLEAFED